MGALARVGTGEPCVLHARHLIGRSPLAQLRLSAPDVSAEHASIGWTGSGWELRDLGSRNGTYVDDVRAEPGGRIALRVGAVVRFGSPDTAWQLVDDAPPSAAAVPLDGGEAMVAAGGILALPSIDAPEVSIYREAMGAWVIDRDGAIERARSGDELVAGRRRFRLVLPESHAPTGEVRAREPVIGGVHLHFAVSRDEEHVALTAHYPGGVIDLGERSHHYMLLTLARARLRDRAGGCGEPEEGWVYHDELARMLAVEPGHLNIAVFRCRRQLGEAGVVGAAEIVERRRTSRQIRLGVRDVQIDAG